jgi:hypothetical protein
MLEYLNIKSQTLKSPEENMEEVLVLHVENDCKT